MTHTEAPVKVLKITGLGRSGSTILDVVLGNHPDIESVGEASNLIRNGWISRESLRGIDPSKLRVPICTCGKRLDVLYVDTPDEACPFWASVRRQWLERADGESIESYPRLQNDFELKRRWSRYGLDPLPRLLYERRRPSAPLRSYARLTRTFFESIRAVSGKPVIVDSTMVPIRTLDSPESGSRMGLYSAWPQENDAPALRGFRGRPQGRVGKDRFPDRARPERRRRCRLFGQTDAGRAQHRRQQDEKVWHHNATTGRTGMEDSPLPYGATTFMDVDGMALAPIWISEVASSGATLLSLLCNSANAREAAHNPLGPGGCKGAQHHRASESLIGGGSTGAR